MKKKSLRGIHLITVLSVLFLSVPFCHKTFAQANFKPWGNLEGIWIKGQLMKFNTNVTVVGQKWSDGISSGKEKQRPQFTREANKQIVTTSLGGFKFTETVVDEGEGAIKLIVSAVALKDTMIKGIYLDVALNKDRFAKSIINLDGQTIKVPGTLSANGEYLNVNGKNLNLKSLEQSFIISSDAATLFSFRPDANKNRNAIMVSVPVYGGGSVKKGEVVEKIFYLKSWGKIDQSPVNLKLNTAIVGRPFAGLGGNFRLQNPKMDPQVIEYCLKNLRVAFGRVEMPWRNWQPEIDGDPIAAAESGKLNQHVAESMAQTLGKMNMPVIVSAWFPPAWAVIGRPQGRSPEGIWGNQLNHKYNQQIYKSIADYLIYLRDKYGVEARYFSFNESDLGINVRQTAEEHNELIRQLGAYFVSRFLKTTVILGDNSDATTYEFTYPALNDSSTKPYIDMVSFHSWRGFDTETLTKWANIAKKINQPLIVGEGSIDAQGYSYPAYFQEQGYAIEEIELYIRLLSICQPLSILQWQLTSDYSPLIGGGLYGDNTPLRPTWRFFNLKQLASTPANLKNMSLVADKPGISCAALGDNKDGVYTIHIVNNGAARTLNMSGIPAKVKGFNIYVTDKNSQMQKVGYVKRNGSTINFKLRNSGFTTLTTSNF
jgi:hypothetical protein